MSLADDLLGGSRRALARVITLVENEHTAPRTAEPPPVPPGQPTALDVLSRLFPHTGRAHVVGVTGPPGSGKSTLVNRLVLELRAQGRTVGIVAVDPTSPFTGGAILGDRIRMRDLAGDPGVFIRSMASRGSLGGLARATADVVRVFDAAGFDTVIVETVGAGQAEVEVAALAQTVLVVEAPGMGDDVQAIKAGILEIADILVVNKADDPRAPQAVRALRAMLELGAPAADRPQPVMHHGRLLQVVLPPAGTDAPGDAWAVPVELTNALTGEGVAALAARLAEHRAYLMSSGELAHRERAHALAELDACLREALLARLLRGVDAARLSWLVGRIMARELLPCQAAAELVGGAAASSSPPVLGGETNP